MTFSDPVETLNSTSTELRNWDMRKREGLQDLMIRAADELDDKFRAWQDKEANAAMMVDASLEMQRLRDEVEFLRGQVGEGAFLLSMAMRLEKAMDIRISQMDSSSKATEKMQAAHGIVLEVAELLRART